MEFTAHGSPRTVADRIEQCAIAQGNVTALVVPWESDRVTLRMSVTAVRGDGWAIEHTNLGTIQLTAAGENATTIVIAAHEGNHPDRQRLSTVFARFAEQVYRTFQPAS
jgi:L-rhamnose isomerase